MMQVYADTGAFYSTDPDTALFVGPDNDGILRTTNGYHVDPSAEGQLTGILNVPEARTHNLWDAAQTNAFGGDVPNAMPRSSAPSYASRGTIPFNAGSPVAGPDSGYKLDNTGEVGPWNRIAHIASAVGSTAGGPTDQKGVVGAYGDATTAGWALSAANPLPPTTNAVRWAVGQIVHGEIRYARLRLRVTAPPTGFGLPIATEVFGGDSANGGGKDNKDNPWRYHVPSSAMLLDSALYVSLTVVEVNGAPYSGGRIAPNARVKYRLTYANMGATPLNNAALSVDLPPETQNCPVDETSFTVVSGPNILPHTPTCAGGLGSDDVLNFQTATLAVGESGVVEFEVLTSSGDADVVVAVASFSSSDLVEEVESKSIFTVGAEAFLEANVTATPTITTQSGTVDYTVTVTNRGGATATDLLVTLVLPGTGTMAGERFDYVNMSSVVTGINTVAPLSTVPPTIAPFSVENRQELQWDFGTATLAAGASFTIDVSAVVGANVPLSPPDYFTGLVIAYDDANISDSSFWLPAVAPVTIETLTTDRDGDGIDDEVDVDDDGDGIADLLELPAAFGTADPGADADNDGVPNYRDPEFLAAAGLQPEDLDADGDGIPNHLDRDSDGDGLTDAWEADGSDLDGDGIRDGCFPVAADGECASGAAAPRNTDNDGSVTPDYLDEDSDDDGVLDSVEAHDVDGNGVADTLPARRDTDGDGIDDAFDPDCATASDCGGIIGVIAPLPDANGVGEPNVLEVCGDRYVASFEACDDGDTNDANDCSNACLNNLGQPCSTDTNCESGICNQSQGICSVCDDDAAGNAADTGCMGAQAICDESATPTCVTCADDTPGGTDSGCSIQSPVCDASGVPTCLACEDDAAGSGIDNGCGGGTPLCDTTGAQPICVECLRDSDCPGGGVCNASNSCVECLVDADCPATEACNAGSLCVPRCTDDADCTDPRAPVCDVAASTCVGCLTNADCLATDFCDAAVCQPTDSDGDGVGDATDLDDDNDGVPDSLEVPAGFLVDPSGDEDGDGELNWEDPEFLASLGLTPQDLDFDQDGIPNHLDLDADGDGITDIVEAGGFDGDDDGVVDGFADGNADGLDDAVAASPLPVPDTDLDLAADFLDLDSDDDGIEDSIEGHDANHDGVADIAPAGSDADGDGIDDAYDGTCVAASDCAGVIGTSAPVPDLDGDNLANYRDSDDDDDGRSTSDEAMDAMNYTGSADEPTDVDGDGLPNWYDTDSDDDGLIDAMETSLGLDEDGNGIPDYLDPSVSGDSDRDGLSDDDECPAPGSIAAGTCRDSDDDGTPDYLDVDDDNDGILTRDEFLQDGPDGNPANDMDWDDDGVPNHLDLDSDNDGVTDIVENGDGALDADGNGRIDDATDADGDGLAEAFDPDDTDDESFERGVLLDTDADGSPDAYDLDADGDGVPDSIEAGAPDEDGDGFIDDTRDADEDGVADAADADADGAIVPPDTDEDGTPDFQDLDSDGDGVSDLIEAHDADGDGQADSMPGGADVDGDGLDDTFDPSNGGTPATLPDLDGDGTPDWRDVDDDGDGVPTASENPDPNGDGDNEDAQDTDGDGTPDYLDTDDDGDGIDTKWEVPDPDGNGDPGDAQDTYCDGIADFLDPDDDGDGLGTKFEDPDPDGDGNPSDARDTDGDGVADYLDDDDDGDGIPTAEESADPDGDGDPSDAEDSDGDGVPDYLTPPSGSGAYLLGGGSLGCSAAGAGSANAGWLALMLLGFARMSRRRRRGNR